MRGGICTVQQALTAEATSLVKQAVSLAKRRGHAQVTPLHVASAMLATSTGLLRKACLQCHSHPLQCKALELCFNVALNRLPASSPSPLLGPHYTNPSFSNALIAAFKRAQAHQRRGSVENQQQPILALKIELEQLIISILDDPSVSRVMREAGFSSTQVKSRVEQAVSLEICSQSSPGSNGQSKESSVKPLNGLGSHVSQSIHSSQFSVPVSKPFDPIRHEDVNNVLNVMLNKRKNTVIVGESLATVEGVARGVMETFERGNASGNFSYLRFISLPLFSLRNISKEEVEQKLMELRCVVKSYMGRGVVLYLGDLSWVSEFWSSTCPQQRRNSHFAMEQIIMELKRMVSGIGDTINGRVWLMGISTFQTYMRCKTGHPSLETLWELHPLTIPVGNLSLSLKFESDLEPEVSIKASKDKSGQLVLLETADENKNLSCCADCSCNFDKHNTNSSTISSLPSWLQKYREENKRNTSKNQEYCITVGDLCKKWNSSFCSSGQKYHNFAEKPLNFASLSPTNSFSSHDCNLGLHDQSHQNRPVSFGPKQSPKEYQFWVLENNEDGCENNVKMFTPEGDHEPAARPELLSNPNSSPNSASSSEVMEEDHDEDQSFKELTSENLRILCDEMEKNVPWQKGIVPEIATTLLQCRSGMSQRRGKFKTKEEKEESCWLFFLGADAKGKEKVARTLAKLVFGSQTDFVSIGLSNFSSTRADSTEENSKNKRTRNELGCSYVQRFGEAVNENPHRVFFMEDLEEVDHYSQKGIKNAIGSGRITLPGGETVPLKDAIVIFSCESFSSVSRACSPTRSQKPSDVIIIKEKAHHDDGPDMEEKSPWVSLDLNIAVEDDDEDHDAEDSDSHVGILECVDRKIVFKVQEL
ncbi:Butenolide signaling repressing protein-like [Trema orientale]|uniref:Butenolide signaling repressing protein-like n=1 Tax=Trema orientale TaxID=63057 RepID=A0A2P5EFQ2_TREOI|nr:Butenolide signaling repressing protein-like [Trema orientale]